MCVNAGHPLGTLMTQGCLPVPLETALEHMVDLAAWACDHVPQARAVLASGFPYHHAGASPLQDLAFTIGTAIDYLRQLLGAGLKPAAAVGQIRFQVAVGCQFFGCGEAAGPAPHVGEGT